MLTVLDAFVLVLSIAYATWLLNFQRSPGPPLPPGPKKLPLIGNLLEMPRKYEWVKFTEWAKQYGDMVSVSIPGQTIVIVNSAKTATEMMDKKSRIYSDRPPFPMGELIGWHTVAFLGHGAHHQRHRKVFRQAIGSNSAVRKFDNMSEKEIYRFLDLLVSSPEDFSDHIKRMAGSLILRITYGYETRNGTDPLLSIADLVMNQVSLATSPGGFLVNYIPALRHVPEWVPGAGFKRIAREWGKDLNKMVNPPYEFVEQEMAKGTAKPSVVYEMLKDQLTMSPEDINDLKWVAEGFYAGGADTTVSTIYAFFKAMVLYPEVQAKAQAEIDTIIGNDRLPTTADRDSLPYVYAIVSEALRWHVVAPVGLFHRVIEDDVHNGYFIPKGTIITPNVWYMTRNPDVHKNPSAFDPTRFIRTDGHEPEPDPRNIIFGFGRRICPGRLLADMSVFATCAMVLAAFDITPHVENGEPVMPDAEQAEGTISHPSPFKCNIVPRSEKAIALIKAEVSARDDLE